MERVAEEQSKVNHILYEKIHQDLRRDAKELQEVMRKIEPIFEEGEKRDTFQKWRLVKLNGLFCAFSQVCAEFSQEFQTFLKRFETDNVETEARE